MKKFYSSQRAHKIPRTTYGSEKKQETKKEKKDLQGEKEKERKKERRHCQSGRCDIAVIFSRKRTRLRRLCTVHANIYSRGGCESSGWRA